MRRRTSTLARPRTWLLLLTGVALGAAQQSGSDAGPDLGAEVERLQRELREEADGLADLGARGALELERRRGDRADLAGRAFEARVALEVAMEEADGRRAELLVALAAADDDERAAADLAAAGAAAAERFAVVLGDVPGHRDRVAALLSSAATLRALDGTRPPGDEESLALDGLAGHAREALLGARAVTAGEARIHTADGTLETVDLLAVGLSQFAYVSREGGRVGVALASPPDASGYRWSEAIDEDVADLVRDAIRATEAGQAGRALVPVDPTGSLRASTASPARSWRERLEAGGPVMVPLGLVAALALLLVLERVVVLFGGNWRRSSVARRVIDACRGGRDASPAYGPFRGGAVGRVLAACVDRRDLGQDAMEDGIQEQLLHEAPVLNRSMNGLAVLGAVAPLLGLLGTVAGIIETFAVLQAFGGGQPTLMAGGVSEALVTTATGLIIAVPILVVRSLLRGRADRILADAERYAASLLMVLVHDDPRR
ncbi:MAG: MotA/TolQ/ExbB proton channel family protein [Planctomycetota bacterium]